MAGRHTATETDISRTRGWGQKAGVITGIQERLAGQGQQQEISPEGSDGESFTLEKQRTIWQ